MLVLKKTRSCAQRHYILYEFQQKKKCYRSTLNLNCLECLAKIHFPKEQAEDGSKNVKMNDLELSDKSHTLGENLRLSRSFFDCEVIDRETTRSSSTNHFRSYSENIIFVLFFKWTVLSGRPLLVIGKKLKEKNREKEKKYF